MLLYLYVEIYNSAILNEEKIENLNRPIISKEIESVTKKLPTKKGPEAHDFTGEFY